jgi:hypothetical protein
VNNQVAAYARNPEIQITRKANALSLVDFPVQRQRMEVLVNGLQVKTERDAIVRMDGEAPRVIGYVGTDYKLVPHAEALQAALSAMDNLGIGYDIGKVSLDRDGARMYAQFMFKKSYEIGQGDILHPVLTLVNGMDGYNALGFDLESVRTVCMNLARSVAKDVSQRFMHTKTAEPGKLVGIAQKSLEQFENKIVPLYREMAKTEITKDMAVRAVAVAVKNGLVPVNVAEFAKHCVESDNAIHAEGIRRTTWAAFNAFTWAATKRGQDLSPTRFREISGNIGRAFADGGKALLKEASLLDDAKMQEIFKKAAA